jgi:branched-chain amino acid transport system ATP-binding protein
LPELFFAPLTLISIHQRTENKKMMILKCRNITKRFGSLAAIDHLSFEVKEGEIFGVAGPNGSGKTTLFNLITGIYPCSGDIFFYDEKISGLSSYKICHKGIARTFQIPQLFLSLSVYENVKAGVHFGNAQKDEDEKKTIAEIIDFAELNGQERTVAANLKLLDKKRTMIATALATKPKLLLLDEPIAGLSPSEIRASIEMFKKINADLGLTVIIIEHFMKVLTELSSRLMILENGRMICLGAPVEVSKDRKVIECYLGDSHA